MRTAAIHQPQYLPYLGFFHKLANADVFVAMDTAQFQRRGVQHRNKIKTKEGGQWLTVPVLTPRPRESDGRSEQATRDVVIDPTDEWQRRHWNAIRLNYARAPFFDAHGDAIRDLLERPWSKLSHLAMVTTEWLMQTLGIGTPIVQLSELSVGGSGSELLANVCKAVGADQYLSGPGGKRYIEPHVFDDAGIGLMWQEFTAPQYPQLYPEAGFIPDLSTLDALLCCGPQTSKFVE